MTRAESLRPGSHQSADDAARKPLAVPHQLLAHERPFTGAIPDSSVRSVHKVVHLDGRTRIIAGRQPGGPWLRLRRRVRFTRDHVEQLRSAGVSEVILRRGLRRASFPLAWMSTRRD